MRPLHVKIDFQIPGCDTFARSGDIGDIEVRSQKELCNDLELSPAYYRGLAYLQAGETKAAVAEFQQVIDHRYLAESPVYVRLSKLEMGHVFQILGNNIDASRAFDELDEIWKNADQDFPPLQRLRVYEESCKH